MATYNLGSYVCPASVTQNVVIGDTVTIRVFSNPNVGDPSHSVGSTNCTVSGSAFSGTTYTINNFSGSSYSATFTDDDNFTVTVSGTVSQADSGTISVNNVTEGGSISVVIGVNSYNTSEWHYRILRNSGDFPEGVVPSYATVYPASGNQTITVALGDDSTSEVQYQGESFTAELRTGPNPGVGNTSGTLLDSDNFLVFDDDTGITSVGNLTIASGATYHSPSISYSFSDSGGPLYIEYRVVRTSPYAGIVYTGLGTNGLSPPSGTVTPIISDIPPQGSTYTYRVDVYNGNVYLQGPSYTVTRQAPAFVAPVISSVTDNNAASSSVTTTVNLSSAGSGGTLYYNKTNSSTAPAINDAGWQTSNVFTQSRDTNNFYWAQRSDGSNRAISSSVAKYIGFLSPDTTIDNIPDQSIPYTDTSFTITISGGGSTTEYQVRDNVATHESRTGNGTITVTDVPAEGGTKSYTVFARLPTAAGGNNTYTATNEFWSVFRGTSSGGGGGGDETGGTGSGNNRIALGKVSLSGGGTSYGLFVSKQGQDVISGTGVLTDEENLIFDSREAEGGMILASGSASLTYSSLPAVSSWINFPQTYSFEPVVLVARSAGSSAYRTMPEVEYQSSASGTKTDQYFRFTTSLRIYVEVQTSRFRIHADTSAGNNMSARPTNFSSPLSFRYLVLNVGGATSS